MFLITVPLPQYGIYVIVCERCSIGRKFFRGHWIDENPIVLMIRRRVFLRDCNRQFYISRVFSDLRSETRKTTVVVENCESLAR